jgi:hypothetical protein
VAGRCSRMPRGGFGATNMTAIGTFRTWREVRVESGMRTKADVHRPLRWTTPPPASISRPAADEMAVRALARFRPPRARGLAGEAAIASRPGNCLGNCRLNEGPPNAYQEGCCHAPSHIPGRKPLRTSRPDRWTRASLVNRSGRRNSFGHLVDGLRLRLRGIVDPLADGTAATPRHRARATAGRGKFVAAAYACGAGRLRSQKQKDADQQTCCKCPEA